MFNSFINVLFGCAHRNTTFPLTPNRKSAVFSAPTAARHGTYVVCLDCGKEFGYDWNEMRVGQPVLARNATTATAESYSQ
jgi:hypothetical protein